MRLLVRDGVPLVHDLPGCEYEFAASCPHWRPLSQLSKDRVLWEALQRYEAQIGKLAYNDAFEVLEMENPPELSEPRPVTLRRIGDA